MRIATAIALCVVAVLSAGAAVSSAASGGNSANAKLCQQGGWTTLARSEDSSSFSAQGACVSYAAQGGSIMPKGRSQLYCESVSGTFSTNPATNMDPNPVRDGEVFAWSCNGAYLPALPLFRQLLYSCVEDFGQLGRDEHSDFWASNTPDLIFDTTCYRRTT